MFVNLIVWLMYLYPKCNVLLPVTPRVSALAGCYRLGIRALGYREHRFFTKTMHYNQLNYKNQFYKLKFYLG